MEGQGFNVEDFRTDSSFIEADNDLIQNVNYFEVLRESEFGGRMALLLSHGGCLWLQQNAVFDVCWWVHISV